MNKYSAIFWDWLYKTTATYEEEEQRETQKWEMYDTF